MFVFSHDNCVTITTMYKRVLKPILNLKHIVENESLYREVIMKRETPKILSSLDFVVNNRPKALELQNQLVQLKRRRTNITNSIKALKGGKPAGIEELKELKTKIKGLETNHSTIADEILKNAELLPNLVHDSVTDTEQILEYINFDTTQKIPEPSETPNEQFDHSLIGVEKGIFDFKQAAHVSGSSFYYLVGDGALLENALVQYSLLIALNHGYKYVIPPSIVNKEVINACGFKPYDQNDEKQVYEIEDSDLSLIGTSEIPLAAFHTNKKFDGAEIEQSPVKYVGCSRAYRAEAGSRGRDTKGLYRVHEFTKLELFHFTHPKNSNAELEEIMQLEKSIISGLGLKARIINIPFNDLGAPAYKKYDIEAWMPGRNNWGELTSCSNCTDYQSRRLFMKYYYSNGDSGYVHTLNGTAMAVPRVIVAIIEQNYNPETGKIKIPDVLVPYMGKQFI